MAMSFYDLKKEERLNLVKQIYKDILLNLQQKDLATIRRYFSDEDTYIRKATYTATGKIFIENKNLQVKIILTLKKLLKEEDSKIRQTTINAAGEIGIKHFKIVEHFFDKGLFDLHHSVRNAVIGSVKKMGNKNPRPVFIWARKFLNHHDIEVRREICHGIELRGRMHPEDILPLLKELQHDKTARVRNTLIHVIGQISYKKGCLPTVIHHLNSWKNAELKDKAVEEIIDVHHRYRNFSALTQKEATNYINKHYKTKKSS
jgi:hypothetical protein